MRCGRRADDVRAPERCAHGSAELLRDIVARHPTTSAASEDGCPVVEIPLRADHHHAAARKLTTFSAVARSERRRVHYHEIGAPVTGRANNVLTVERLGAPTCVIPVQQVEGEPAHHRVRQRDQHTRPAVAHRAAVA